MYKPSPILTFTTWKGESHVDIENRYDAERRRRALEWVTSPEVREALKDICRELIEELGQVYDHRP